MIPIRIIWQAGSTTVVLFFITMLNFCFAKPGLPQDFRCYHCSSPMGAIKDPKVERFVKENFDAKVFNPKLKDVSTPNCASPTNFSTQIRTVQCEKRFCMKWVIAQSKRHSQFVIRTCAEKLFKQTTGDIEGDRELFEGLKPECQPTETGLLTEICVCTSSLCNSASLLSPFSTTIVALVGGSCWFVAATI